MNQRIACLRVVDAVVSLKAARSVDIAAAQLIAYELPIVLAAVLVFVASSVIHMFLGYHASDYGPVPNEESDSLPRDAEILIVGKENRDNPRPFIVFGDLNDVAWSRTNYLFQNVSGLLDPRVGRGFYHTFHAGIPLLRFPLDHFFHSKHFRVADFRRLRNIGSDHFPVYVELSLEWDAPLEQEELEPEEEEVIDAERTIRMAHEREAL